MFKPFDTVQVSFPKKFSDNNLEIINGILLYCENSQSIIGLHDNVFINITIPTDLGKKFNCWSYMGYNINLNTTRIVLFEKIDFELIQSYNDLPFEL